MSDHERDLLRIHAWDAYLAARDAYLAHRSKLQGWGRGFGLLSKGLTETVARMDENSWQSLPTKDEYITEMQEFKQVKAELRRSWITARDFGFTVDADVLKEIGS